MAKTVQIYANIANITKDGDGVSVLLTGINTDEVISEFSEQEVLDSLDFSSIHDYVAARLAEEES